MIRAPSAWEATQESADVTLGILDTGVDYDHPDLSAQFGSTKGADFVDEDNDDPHPNPPRWFVQGPTMEHHGTKVAGIAAATRDNDEGIAGVSNARVLNARAVPGGTLPVETAHPNCPEKDMHLIRQRLAAGTRYLVDQGADIINMSIGAHTLESYREEHGDEGCDDPDWEPVWDDAVEYALENDVLLVAGTGNQGNPSEDAEDPEINYPAKKSGVLAVSGVTKPNFLREQIDEDSDDPLDWELDPARWETDPRDWDVQMWGDTERGSRYNEKVDVCAPVDPLGPITKRWYTPDDYKRNVKAISWAVPVVSGVAALALAENPSLSAAELRTLLRSSARDLGLPDHKQGAGLVDAANAVESA
jgi:serine protease